MILDLFILTSIFQGLADHTRQLTSPDEYIPQYCRDIVIDQDWNESNSLIRTAEMVSSYRDSYVYADKRNAAQDMHAVCEPIATRLHAMEDDKVLSEDLGSLLNIRNQINQTKSELNRTKGAYDTSLLEIIADKNTDKANTSALEKQVTDLTAQLDALSKQETETVLLLMSNKNISEWFGIISASSNEKKDLLLEELRNLNYWYPAKRLGMEMIFLLPMVVIFYLWNSRSINKGKPYQKLISSHLLVVVFIPVICKVMELVYEIIPKKFFQNFFELLESLGLVVIWHYVIMAMGIVTTLALIHFMQKKIFSKEKLAQKRIAKGRCQNCAEHLPIGSNACSVCGFMQYRQCSHCNKSTYVFGKYCRECGVVENSQNG